MTEPTTIEDGARDLVRRARLGDQNAMAMIAAVAQNAETGDTRARRAKQALEAYIRQHPADDRDGLNGSAGFGNDRVAPPPAGAPAGSTSGTVRAPLPLEFWDAWKRADSPRTLVRLLGAACVHDGGPMLTAWALAEGDPLEHGALFALAGTFPSSAERQAFAFGVGNPWHADAPAAVAEAAPHGVGALCVGMIVGRARAWQKARAGDVWAMVGDELD